MESFSYLSTVTSIIIALGIARILTGLGSMIEDRGEIRPYFVHLLWALNIFLFLVLNRWILFRWESNQDWNYFLLLFLLLTPTVAFLLAVLLFPTVHTDKVDFKSTSTRTAAGSSSWAPHCPYWISSTPISRAMSIWWRKGPFTS